jgi:deoxyribonuclease-2
MKLVLLLTYLQHVLSISCKDELGNNIRTWTIMKLPRGTDYYYYDTNTGYKYSPHSLNDTSVGALAHTLKQLWNENTNYVIYNDEPPNSDMYNYSVAHSKGVWIWNNTSAILITHSIPKFPQGPKETPYYTGLLSNAWEYGQNVVCFEISIPNVEPTIQSIQKTAPLIYESEPRIHSVANNNLNDNICEIKLIDNITVFIKTEDKHIDIWASCISNYYNSQVFVESWIHGTMDGPFCPPTFKWPTLDIGTIEFPEGQIMEEKDDHSKWGILNESVVCFGDLNRVTTQMERGGSVYCWEDTTLWMALKNIIKATNNC